MALPLDSPFPTPFPPDLGQEIQRRTPRVAGPATLTHLPAGSVVTPVPFQEEQILPFHPVRIAGDITNGFNAYLRPAWVHEKHIELTGETGGPVRHVEPLIDGEGLWARPAPPLPLTKDLTYTYLAWNTTYRGLAVTNYNVITSASKLESVQHVPPDPGGTGGTNGEYYVELFRTNLGDTNLSNRVQLKWGGHYPSYQSLWQGYHPGGDSNAPGSARPYLDFDEDTNRHRFRVLVSDFGINVKEQTYNIIHRFKGANIGYATKNYINVYQGDHWNDGSTTANFNQLQESFQRTEPQVRLAQFGDDQIGYILGNDQDKSYAFRDCDGNIVCSLVFRDGLLHRTSSGNTTIQLGDCTNGTP